ncbi:MAG: biotin--[acetyl-CoA-carboxylase] ligase [Blautia sp.]|uniref:biotin--[acetyl-CoA-carboxylase] ligase n=1 Tax=Blautia sp. TaxID=1955243 RepID=UPI002E759BD8|nr:biotin--[acetyl-CoA-carboxylase] ligase [Blautia sp.]MEE1442688.1 biotin--[acetyl-CoA-carboxylase] ligase [Blautia sp.]
MSTKSRLLQLLEQEKGNYLSGERLAEKLQVSRTAIWKAIQSLRQEGYAIQAVTNKGYALDKSNDVLCVKEILSGLECSEAVVQVFREIPSTSLVMKKMALEGRLPHGSVVVANEQTQGKGRKGREFYSPKDSGLYLSVLLYPEKTVKESLELTAEAAVAVCRAVEICCGISLKIKWVNDLYLEEKKVCGILTEAVTDFETGEIEFVVVGIGLNLRPPEKGFPEDIQKKAGAILKAGEFVDRNKLTATIVNELLKETGKKGIPQEFIVRNLVPGRTICIVQGSSRRRVKAKEILPDGRLRIYNEQDEEELLSGAEVSLEL